MHYAEQHDPMMEPFEPGLDDVHGDARFDDDTPWVVELVRQHPAQLALVGFAALFFVVFAVNALFLQTHKHPSAFFETRASDTENTLRPDERMVTEAPDKDVTRILLTSGVRPTPAPDTRPVASIAPTQEDTSGTVAIAPIQASVPAGDEVANPVAELQTHLFALGHYEGSVDGLMGPKTRQAIATYKASVGLDGPEVSQDDLLASLRSNAAVANAVPRREDGGSVTYVPPVPPTSAPTADAKARIMRVQAGLRAFGNSSIEVDGVYGSQTRASIREFQALFELPVTGEIDQALIEKMVTIGLVN
ncbi:MAG: peptidoglycan-binding domain-containing protein [Pseudomonadota bacterium]